MKVFPPDPEPQDIDPEIISTSGASATEDEEPEPDPGVDKLSTGTNLGEQTPDRATGLTAFN